MKASGPSYASGIVADVEATRSSLWPQTSLRLLTTFCRAVSS